MKRPRECTSLTCSAFSSPEMVQENTGFEIDVTRAELMEGPDPEIIRLIREEIDPGQAFIKVPKENK